MYRLLWKISSLSNVLVLVWVLSAQAQAVSCEPVGYWKFNEGTGTTANDASPGLHHGTLLGTSGLPTWVAGKIGTGAIDFDGVSGNNRRVEVPHHADYDITDTISLVSWVKRLSITTNDAIINKTNGTQFDWQFYITAADFVTFWADSSMTSGLGSTGTVADTNWHLVGITKNGTAIAYYIDNAASGTRTATAATMLTRTHPVILGSDGTAGDHFGGSIDDPRVYPCTLTATDITTTLFNFTEAPPPSSTRRIIISKLQGPRPWIRPGKYKVSSILPWLNILGMFGREVPAW